MITDKNGNIYISMENYYKDFYKLKSKLQSLRKSLLSTKQAMKKMYNKRDDIEGQKALGYIECIEHLDKYLLEILLELGEVTNEKY